MNKIYRVKSGSIELAVETFGKGLPLIYAHGLLCNRNYSRNRLMPLADKYKIIIYDARGHGDSTPVTDPVLYNADKMAGDTGVILDALNIEQAIVGGESMGAATALLFALKWPKRVLTLLLTAPAISDKPNIEAEQFAMLADVIANKGMDTAIEEVRRQWATKGASSETTESFITMLRSHNPDSIIVACNTIKDWVNLYDPLLLKELNFPVHILAWEGDPVHPMELANCLKASFNQASLKIIDSPFKSPEDFSIVGKVFLQELNGLK